jgi:hypothetical protein
MHKTDGFTDGKTTAIICTALLKTYKLLKPDYCHLR